MQGGSILALSPSFNSYSSSRFAEIAVKVSREFSEQREELGLDDVADPDFEEHQTFIKDEIYEEVEEFGWGNEVNGPNGGVESIDELVEEKSVEAEQRSKEDEEGEEEEENEEEEEEDDDFEFSVACRDPESLSITADEIFSNGQIRPIYPLFDRTLLFKDGSEEGSKLSGAEAVRIPLGKLLIKERDPSSSSSSEADELESIPAGTYCVWTPKSAQATPERCKKSNSTGSSKRWRFRDFLLRSNSDGKDTFVFLAPSATKSKKIDDKRDKSEKPTATATATKTAAVPKVRRNSDAAGKPKGKGVAGDASPASAHEMHYVRNRAQKEGDRRRSYLPYRQDLVGLFANVNGLSRNLHPF